MKINFLPLLAALLMATNAFSQEAMFKVLASKGANKIISATTGEQKVLIGQKLLTTDKIVLGENAYLGLAHKTGKTIELKKAGTYEVSKLSGEVASQNAGVASKYVSFVAGEISSQDEDLAKNRHKYMQVTGSVERDVMVIKPICSKEVYCLADQVMLKWYPYNAGANHTTVGYAISLKSLTEDSIYYEETTQNSAVVDLSKSAYLKEDKNVIWNVVAKVKDKKTGKITEVKSENFVLKYLSDEHSAKIIEKEAADLKSELTEETALNKFVLANFYDEKGLVLEALANYEAAIKLEPEVEDYKVAIGQFLEKSKMTAPNKK